MPQRKRYYQVVSAENLQGQRTFHEEQALFRLAVGFCQYLYLPRSLLPLFSRWTPGGARRFAIWAPSTTGLLFKVLYASLHSHLPSLVQLRASFRKYTDNAGFFLRRSASMLSRHLSQRTQWILRRAVRIAWSACHQSDPSGYNAR